MNVGRLVSKRRTPSAACNRLRQIIRRLSAQRLVSVREVLAVEFVEIAVVGRMMLRTIPPVPVAALGDQDLLPCQGALRVRRTGSGLSIIIPRRIQIVPGFVVLGRSDPDVEIRVDPRSRHQRTQMPLPLCRAIASLTVTASIPGHAGAHRKTCAGIRGPTADSIPKRFRHPK